MRLQEGLWGVWGEDREPPVPAAKGLFPHNVLNSFCLPQSLSVSNDLIFPVCLHFLLTFASVPPPLIPLSPWTAP